MGVSRDLHRVVVETDVARALNSCVQNQNRLSAAFSHPRPRILIVDQIKAYHSNHNIRTSAQSSIL